MNGLSIFNFNKSHFSAGFANNAKENNADNIGSPVSKMDSIEVFTPPEPFDVLEPIEIENHFENPYDWESVKTPFEMVPPEEFEHVSASDIQIEVDVPSVVDALNANAQPSSVMEPYTFEDGGTSKSALSGRKVSNTELNEKYKCSTCESRRYQDVSSDPGVSFQMPTKVSKANSHSAVAAHEKQHVSRNQAKAEREDREVVSQSVTYNTGKCPECGDTYTSGGTTRTVTKAKSDNKEELKKQLEKLSFSFEV